MWREHGKRDGIYRELVESYRTERGPGQRVVAYLGDVSERRRFGIEQTARGRPGHGRAAFLMRKGKPEWVEVDSKRVGVEELGGFGGR